jgi:hypothetical protein
MQSYRLLKQVVHIVTTGFLKVKYLVGGKARMFLLLLMIILSVKVVFWTSSIVYISIKLQCFFCLQVKKEEHGLGLA